MGKVTYRIGGRTLRFSARVFDSFFDGGAKGVAKMRTLAEEINVSVSSIKDWRRGAHSPSDIEKVDDIARWAGVEVDTILIEARSEPMEKLSERQLDALSDLWNQAYDFLDLCDETNYFVWHSTRLENIPPSLLHDVVRSDESYERDRPGEMVTSVMFVQIEDAYTRALRRAYPYVGETEIYGRLADFAGVIDEVGYGEAGDDWVPDPDMIFEHHPEGYAAPMVVAARKGRKMLDEIDDELVAMRKALNGSIQEIV